MGRYTFGFELDERLGDAFEKAKRKKALEADQRTAAANNVTTQSDMTDDVDEEEKKRRKRSLFSY